MRDKPTHHTGSIKYLYSQKNSSIERLKFVIQNRCDKVVMIEGFIKSIQK